MVAVSMFIGTRKSTMALAQTEYIGRRLSAAVPDLGVEIVKFETAGDYDQTSKLLSHGGKGGAFVAEIGGRFIEVTRSGPADRPRELGRAVGLELLDRGAAEIIAPTLPEP